MGSWRGAIAWLSLLGLLLAACAAPGAGSGGTAVSPPAQAPATSGPPVSSPGALLKVPAAYSAASGAQLVILLAEQAGLFRERGLAVELTLLGGDRAIQSLVAGQIAFATIPGVQLVNAAVGGAPVVTVAQDMETVGLSIHADPSIRELRGLRGKRIGITVPGTLTDLAARVVIREAGLRVGEDVALVNVGSVQDLVPAMAAGAADAAVLSMPASLRAREAGFPELVDVASLGRPARIIHNTLASRRDYLEEQPEAARRFVDAYAAAVRLAREDLAAARAAVMRWLDIDDPALAEATAQYYVRLLKDPPRPSPESWRALLELMADLPEVHPAVRTTAPETLIDTRFFSS